MTSRLPTRLLVALERLEQVSAGLKALDPEDHSSLEAALAERRSAIADLTEALAGASTAVCEELFRRIEQILGAGREAMIRITLARENTRSQLSYVNQELHWLRAMQRPGKGGVLDCSG